MLTQMYWRGGIGGEVLSALQISIAGAIHPQPTPTIATTHHHNALQAASFLHNTATLTDGVMSLMTSHSPDDSPWVCRLKVQYWHSHWTWKRFSFRYGAVLSMGTLGMPKPNSILALTGP